ncbi:MAG: hypothetical protein JWO06_400 [Bacteroidota bacterium]|nr:hypothetical protein [Bacteroidota bacterium]
MKKALSAFVVFATITHAFSQQMHVKSPNFNSFKEDKKKVPELLVKKSSALAKQHPEYGVLPYNAQCSECIELIDKRTLDTRQFIDPQAEGHTYSQTSFFPLHYKKTENDIWRTIDKRLRPVTGKPGVYEANNQPVPTRCDLSRRTTTLNEHGFEFEFNKELSAYFFDDNTLYSKSEKGDYTNFSVGEEGLLVKNMWKGIDMQQKFREGEIETEYVINAPLQLPITKGWLVIEDHFNLPEGYTFDERTSGQHIDGGYYRGDYLVRNAKGDTLIEYKEPVYVDGKAFGMHGMYKLLKAGNSYTLSLFVPVEWLLNPDHTYPLLLDPTVHGVTKDGDFLLAGPSANMKFTSMALGSCDYFMTVNVPGKSQLTNAYVDVEYSLTYDNTCGNPVIPPPYCTFSQVSMEVVNPTCGTTTGLLTCNPAAPPYTGTCTTDSNLVPGAHALLINNFNPTYMSCIPPQCADFSLPFTLKNRDSICGDVCGYLCANGHMWQMTVEACQVGGFISQDKTQECAGQPVTFTAHGNCGVPPYHYAWTTDGGTTFDTIWGSPDFVLHPQQTLPHVYCVIIDTCDNPMTSPFHTNVLADTVIPAPPADAGPDQFLCEGGQITLGGNPTTTGATIVWTGSDPTVASWLSNNQSANPTANVPVGTVDTFYYVVTATNSSCFRTDTAMVFSLSNPIVVADTSGSTRICANQSVRISATPGFASYVWNDGNTDSVVHESIAGPYFVIVTDQHGCKDTSNTIIVQSVGVPSVHVFPDTTIRYGDSVVMYTDINLNSVSIDSFTWYPFVNISCLTCSNPVVAPISDQYYGVTVYTAGCSISDSALVKVILPNNFFIPNAFTPNGDGNNDEFYIQSQAGVRVVMFQVFNRIGEKVHDGNYPWDGKYKGQPAPGGVYVYMFKLGLFGNDQALFRKGSVTLVR